MTHGVAVFSREGVGAGRGNVESGEGGMASRKQNAIPSSLFFTPSFKAADIRNCIPGLHSRH